MLSVRPKVAELTFQLYGRSLHPELFHVHKSHTVERGGYSAKIDITSAGHVVTWRFGGLTLTEVAASAQHPLPQRRRLLSYKLRGERNGPRRMPRRDHVPDQFSARAGCTGSVLDVSAGAGVGCVCGEACCIGSMPAAAWRWAR